MNRIERIEDSLSSTAEILASLADNIGNYARYENESRDYRNRALVVEAEVFSKALSAYLALKALHSSMSKYYAD